MRENNFIKSLARGFQILESFGNPSQRLTLSEVATACDINKAATQRFLSTLHTLGYLNRDINKRYVLSPKILSLGFGYLSGSNLRNICKPHIDELSAQVNRTANLGILDGTEVLYLYRREVTKFMEYNLYAGSKIPAYCTSSGKILLAGLDTPQLNQILDQMVLKKITERTITSKTKLIKDIEKTKKRGFSICDRELSMDLYSVAIPLFDEDARTIAAINVTMPAEDKHKPKREEVIARLIEKGKIISTLLNYQGPYPALVAHRLS